MKTQILVNLCLGLGLAVIPAAAQSGGVRAKVPFNFSVNGKILPAGEYTMTVNAHLVRIQDARQKVVALAVADYASGRSAGNPAEIIFHCYGEFCLLSEIWSPVKSDGRRLDTSQTETKLSREKTGKYFAVLGEGPGK